MFHMRLYSHATKPRLTFQISRDGVFPGATSWRVTSSEWGWVGLLRGSVEGEVLPIRSDSKDLRDFARLRAAFNRGSDLNHEPLTESRHHHW